MPSTLEDLQDFTTFARGRINGEPTPTLRELFQAWLEERETAAVVADMEASEADIAAGRVTQVHEAFDEVRAKLGIKK